MPSHTGTDPLDPFITARELAAAIRNRRVSATEVTAAALDRIDRLNPSLNAYLAVFDEGARRAAARVDRARGTPGPLCGVPVSIKDLILTTDAPTTAGSRIYGAGQVADRDALLVRRLRRAGAIVLGKTNLHEVALGVTTVNEHFGPARNPWDTRRMSGGSSGGSAVALAAGLGPLSIGTDTRGSIRIPAACCGITGLKPTRGLVPLDGVLPLSPTLDHAGPMARTAGDGALLLGVLAGGDPLRFVRATHRVPRRLRLGISAFHLRDLDGEVQRVIETALRRLGRIGGRLREVRVGGVAEAHAASARISAPEAYAVHETVLRERPDGFGPPARGGARVERGGLPARGGRARPCDGRVPGSVP
jgi:aspartyl-tRNA(Asn)/glutamyl-tRNA(Gln) amidotransferase subunit A